jgi:NAD(P)-dependent dehydrogenase (short-subunit alcohol dehydrogenase family)
MSKPKQRQIVLITGAASGIGRETARAFAERGATLELADLNGPGLLETKTLCEAEGAKAVHIHQVDVSDPEAMAAFGADVHRRVPAVDVLINNAGIGAAGRFLDASLETWRKTLDINLMGVVHGCRSFVPAMVARGQGGSVVNVASVAGLVGMPDMPVYCTSKYAVVGLSESLRGDLARHNIRVSCICPGVVDTAIVHSTLYEGKDFTPEVRQGIQKFYAGRKYTPRKVADAIVSAVDRGAGLVPVTPESWLMWLTQRAAPGLIARLGRGDKVFAHLQKRRPE